METVKVRVSGIKLDHTPVSEGVQPNLCTLQGVDTADLILEVIHIEGERFLLNFIEDEIIKDYAINHIGIDEDDL